MVLQEYCFLKESRISLKPVLGGINRLNKTESAVFIYCSLFSLFLKDPFFPDYLNILPVIYTRNSDVFAKIFIVAKDIFATLNFHD